MAYTASIFRVEVKIKAVCSSEILVPIYCATRCDSPAENMNLHLLVQYRLLEVAHIFFT
jgi:hypothetical protein